MKSLLALALVALAVPALAAPADQLLDLGITQNGIILRTNAQTCTDKMSTSKSGQVVRSLMAPAMMFSGISLTWKSDDLNLYIGTIQITAKSPNFVGGSQVVQLDGAEIEAMFGIPGAVVNHASGHDLVYSSTSNQKGKSAAGDQYMPCGLGVGGLTLDPTKSNGSFTADVEIKLIGSAASDDGSVQQNVVKTINTTATYY